jgi:hypothetical protein
MIANSTEEKYICKIFRLSASCGRELPVYSVLYKTTDFIEYYTNI